MAETALIRIHVALENRLLRDVLTEALRREDGMHVVGSTAEGVIGLDATSGLGSDVVVFCEPRGEDPCKWVGSYREASAGSKIVLLAMGRRAVDLTECGADAVVDAGDGVDELVPTIRHVVAAD